MAGEIAWNGANNVLMLNNETGGPIALQIGTGGNVGIGTSTPAAALQILMPAAGINLKLDKTTTNAQMAFAEAGTDKWNFYLEASDDSFNIRDADAGVNRMTFDNSGNVGIGTSTSAYRFAVAGGTSFLEQQAWQTPTFQNAWVNYGGVYNPAGYFKDSLGIVHLRGLVKTGTIATAVFTLPAGYRPAYRQLMVSISNGAIARLDVDTTGSVIAQTGSNVWFSLDGATFRAEL